MWSNWLRFWPSPKLLIIQNVGELEAIEPDSKPSFNREINDSKIIAIDYYSTLKKLFKWFTEYCMLVKMLGNIRKEEPTFQIWLKQVKLNLNLNESCSSHLTWNCCFYYHCCFKTCFLLNWSAKVRKWNE